MSMKIAPAPIAPSLPRIAFLPNQQPVLLIPNSYTGKVPVPLRASPNNERTIQSVQFMQPKLPPMQSHHPQMAHQSHEDPMRMMREDSGIAENLPSTQQRREFLKRKIQERPSKQYLIRKHILLTDPLVDPFIGEKTHQLRKQAVVSNLNRKLKTRPGPLDLVTAKILQADAELEEAIKEGRLLFPSSRRELESPSPSIPQAPSPSVLLSTLRISKQESIREEEEARAHEARYQAEQAMLEDNEEPQDLRARKYGRVEARQQPHPYARMDPQQPSPSKGRLKGPETKTGAEYTAIPDNFEAMMKQQELFIEWRTRPEIEMHHQDTTGLHQQTILEHAIQDDGADSDSGETIPYGEEEEGHSNPAATITYRVYPEQPPEQPDSTQMIHSTKNAPRAGNSTSFRSPIFSLSDIKKTDLMQECRMRGLKCGGDKTTIMMRLEGVKDEIIAKFKEEQARIEAAMLENSPQISSERALSNTSSSSSPSTIIDDMAYDNNGMARIDESMASRRHSLPSNNPHQGIAKSLQPPTRHLSMSSGSHPPAPAPTISSLSFTQANPQNGQMERKIQMKTANGEVFYATLPSMDDLPIPRDGKPVGCRITIVNGKPVLQFQQPSGPIEPGSVGAAGIRDTLLFAQNGSGGQVTLGPQKERTRSNSLNRKYTQSGEVNSISSLLRSNSSNTSLPVVVQRTARTQSSSSASSTNNRVSTPKRDSSSRERVPIPIPRDSPRKSSSSPQQPPREPSVQPQDSPEPVVVEPIVEEPKVLSDAEQVFVHVRAINKLLDRPQKITLDAKTVLEHEQAIRNQQRIIDQMQKELKKSYTALKIQQQLIMSAKRAQTTEIAKMTNNKIKSIGEAWLFELNMKRLHKSSSTFFLTHEQQEAELKNMTEEQKKIEKAHINLQMSEASDSAIKDITKFIGSNPKTALLIVQLLKKYQNDKNQSAAQATQTFADVPPFEASKTPTSARPQSNPATSQEFTRMNQQPGPSRVEQPVHDDNGNETDEAIVIDEEANERAEQRRRMIFQAAQKKAAALEQSRRLKLEAAPISRTPQRKQQRSSIHVDMEAIFQTVLEGSKTGNSAMQHASSGSPVDANLNKTIDHSPSHSVSSIPSSSSMAGVHPSTSSSSPCSSSTPPDPVNHQMMQPMHYGNANMYHSHSEGSMEYMTSHQQPLPYEPIPSRPYVRDGVAADDNPTDILMEAVESSGIVDEGIGGSQDEPMPSSSHQMHLDGSLQMLEDASFDQYGGLQEGDNVLIPNEMFDEISAAYFDGADAITFLNDSDFTDAFKDVDTSSNDVHYLDLLEVIRADSEEKKSPESQDGQTKKVSYNGTEELSKVLGPSWMNMDDEDDQPSTSQQVRRDNERLRLQRQQHQPPPHPMQLDIPKDEDDDVTNIDLNEYEDVFPWSQSHAASSQGTSSSPNFAVSPLYQTLRWTDETDLGVALSPENIHQDERFHFDFDSPSHHV